MTVSCLKFEERNPGLAEAGYKFRLARLPALISSFVAGLCEAGFDVQPACLP